MKRINDSSVVELPPPSFAGQGESKVNHAFAELSQNGIVILSGLISQPQLSSMQKAFDSRLKRVRWNDFDGYEKERYRHVVPDLLTIDQGFVDIAIHPVVKETLRRYIGENFALVEAKGWMSL